MGLGNGLHFQLSRPKTDTSEALVSSEPKNNVISVDHVRWAAQDSSAQGPQER